MPYGGADHLLVRALMDEQLRRAEARRSHHRVAERAPRAARVALGHLLVRLGHRLSGVSPGAA
jgi:hypothetical protein